MSKVVDIEYCGAWGYGGPATRLKDFIIKNIEGVQVKCHSANGTTGVIQVSWDKNGKLETVWKKGKQETNENHAQIVALLKQSQWSP